MTAMKRILETGWELSSTIGLKWQFSKCFMTASFISISLSDPLWNRKDFCSFDYLYEELDKESAPVLSAWPLSGF